MKSINIISNLPRGGYHRPPLKITHTRLIPGRPSKTPSNIEAIAIHSIPGHTALKKHDKKPYPTNSASQHVYLVYPTFASSSRINNMGCIMLRQHTRAICANLETCAKSHQCSVSYHHTNGHASYRRIWPIHDLPFFLYRCRFDVTNLEPAEKLSVNSPCLWRPLT